jgi:hypothetical protein
MTTPDPNDTDSQRDPADDPSLPEPLPPVSPAYSTPPTEGAPDADD